MRDEDGNARWIQKNKFSLGDRLEIMKPDGRNIETEVLGIFGDDGAPQESAPHAAQHLHVKLTALPDEYDILRLLPGEGKE